MARATMLAQPLTTWALMLCAVLAAGGTVVAASDLGLEPESLRGSLSGSEALLASAATHSPR
jgi:hypothetical protein